MGLDALATWTQILSFFIPPAVGFAAWIAKRYIQQVVSDMNAMIQERTQPIQKTANGGWSLPDAIKIMHTMDKKIDDVHTRVTNVATDVAHLRGRFDQHIEEGN